METVIKSDTRINKELVEKVETYIDTEYESQTGLMQAGLGYLALASQTYLNTSSKKEKEDALYILCQSLKDVMTHDNYYHCIVIARDYLYPENPEYWSKWHKIYAGYIKKWTQISDKYCMK